MDLKKLTKEELIDMVNDRKHLSSVVSEKDKEIERLKKLHNEELQKKDETLKVKEENIRNEQKAYVEKLKNYVEKQNKSINELLFQYGALLKTIQGSLDSHIYINDKLIESLKEE